jgi:hypothetical protein
VADFSKRISILVDFVTGNTSSGLGKIKADVGDAEGAFNKMKAAGSGAFDLIQQNAGAFALGAGTALVGFGAKAVNTFQETALGAGHLRDALGLSADQASRYLEVSNDLGIGQDALATAFGRMLKTAGSTPQVFHDLGVQIAYAKDGSVDANQTFLNAVDALHNMTDPAQRAAAATKLFGKSWQNMAEVIDMGAAGLKQRLDDVQSSKIVNNDQIAQGYKFRDAVDNVRDAVEGLLIQIGGDLVPTLTTLSGALGAALGPLDKFNEGLHKLDHIPGIKILTEALNPLLIGFHAASDAAHQLTGDGGAINTANIDKATQAMLDQASATEKQANATEQARGSAAGAAPVWAELVNKTGDWSHAADDASGKIDLFAAGTAKFAQVTHDASSSVEENKQKLYDSQFASQAAAAAQKELGDESQRVSDIMRAQADALKAQSDAALASADSEVAANDALERFSQSLTDEDAAAQAAAQAVKDHGASSLEAAAAARDLTNAQNGTRDAAIALAKATEQHAADQAAASGQTWGAVDALDSETESLLATASQAKGPARDAILTYIASLHGIDPKILTDIIANTPNIGEQKAKINDASVTRHTDIQVQQIGAAAAGAQIDAQAHDRHATIYVNSVGGTSTNAPAYRVSAAGGHLDAGEPSWVGDKYGINSPSAELFVPDESGTIYNQDQLAAMAKSGTPASLGGGGAIIFAPNVSVTVGVGANVREFERAVENALAALVRRNGPGPLQRALKIA